MDTSETYIKMADYPKIQQNWHPNIGDLTNYGIIINVKKMVGAPWVLDLIEEDPKDCDCPSHSLSIKRNEAIWLPMQDRIQEMIGLKGHPLDLLDEAYDSWIDPRPPYTEKGIKDLKTMEQLWLAFYMYEKHSKIWNGKNWINK